MTDNELVEENPIPSPSEVGVTLRELAPTLCKKFDTIRAFQEYIWSNKSLVEIRVPPSLEMRARLYCNPPPRLLYKDTITAPTWTLYIDYYMTEQEMKLTYKDGNCEVIK